MILIVGLILGTLILAALEVVLPVPALLRTFC